MCTQVVARDSYGDGWTGALPGRMNTWAITESLSPDDLASPVADGTLPDHHYYSTTTLCLQDGLYAFQSTADTAWSSEATWELCDVTGGAGGSMEFEVRGGGSVCCCCCRCRCGVLISSCSGCKYNHTAK